MGELLYSLKHPAVGTGMLSKNKNMSKGNKSQLNRPPHETSLGQAMHQYRVMGYNSLNKKL